jgi:uroporphyrinogen decarboxylase
MNHRERVQAVFSQKKPNIPVVDMGGRVASLNTSAYLDLKHHLGFGNRLENESVTLLNTIANIDDRILEYFNVPFRRIYLRPAESFKVEIQESGMFADEWGVGYQPMGEYNERIGHPLVCADLHDLDGFPWPDPMDPGRIAGLEEEVHHLYELSDYAIAAGHLSAGVFQDCWNLRGMEQFLCDMYINQEFAEALLDRVLDVHIRMWKQFLEVAGPYVDMVETADDLGTQDSLLISPAMYRDLIKPRHAALNAAIREKTSAKIFFHTCGAVMPLIDDFIEIGVDILNPIQPIPGKMDPDELYRRFGGRLIFHGGLDVQRVLPDLSTEKVRAHVSRYYEQLGSKCYIMAPANSIQPGTPPENIVAAYDTANNFCDI